MTSILTRGIPIFLSAVALPTAAAAVPVNLHRPTASALPDERLAPAPSKAAADTLWFGGTHWDAADARWEANVSLSRSNRWTFDSGVDGNLEGWTSRDLSVVPPPTLPPEDPDDADFRWVDRAKYLLYGTPGTDLFPYAAPPDTGGIWVGKFPQEAADLCYAGGQGYGSNWQVEAEKTFAYGGSGGVRLTYRYFSNSEKNFDYTYLYLEFNGVREISPRASMTFTLGSPGSKRTRTLTVTAASIPPGTTQISTVFRFVSDQGWSDEDGVGFTTVYGPFCCYNFLYQDLGTPANDVADTWETGSDGWSFLQGPGVGRFTGIRNLADLPPMGTPCPCAGSILSGNVLVQHDQSGGPGGPHPDGQDEISLSPHIDLLEAGPSVGAVKLIVLDTYMNLPPSQGVYYKLWLRAYPVICQATGLPMEDEVAPDQFIWNVTGPICFDEWMEDFSTVAPEIEYCRLGLEVLSLCSVSTACTGPTGGNESPWWDNLALAVTGTEGAPALRATDIRWFLQDIWSADGSLRPSSTCILDGSGDGSFGFGTGFGADLEDTICVRAAGEGVEADLRFRYRKGPGTRTTHAFFARYPLEETWYSARCDTARGAGVEAPGVWCSEYHEESPYFAGEDAEANEVFPDRVFTPGSRIDYYWSAHYLATPAVESHWPDVPGGDQALSVDLLPYMRVNAPGDTMLSCHLYINGESRQPLGSASPYHRIESALGLVLPGWPEHPIFDRFDDVLAGSNTNASFGRQSTGENGMTESQALGYRSITAVYGASETYTITDDAASILLFWLTTNAGGANGGRQLLYLSGDGVAVDMSNPLKPDAADLLNNHFGGILRCTPYRDAGCPAGAAADTSFCVQLSPAAGAHADFAFTGNPYRAQGNGCPSPGRFSVLDVNAGVASARPNLDYVDQDGLKGTTHYASVTNDRAGPANGNYRTVFDGVGLSRLRRPAPAAWDCARDSLAIVDRVRDAILWGFSSPYWVPVCYYSIGVEPEEDAAPGVPKANSLAIKPNPFNPIVTLSYAVATPGRVTLRIYDVRGALVATLVDAAKAAGRYEAVWSGADAAGRRLASGVFWAKYGVGESEITRQLVLLK